MTRVRLSLAISIVIAALAPAAPAAALGPCQRDAGWAEMKGAWATEVLALTNAHRATLGLGALAPSESLTAAATWKAAHMAGYEYMTHDDPAPPIGRTWDQRIRDCGYSSGAGENIAYGYRSPQAVVQGWLDSAGHRRNIENPSYKVIGVGAAVTSDGTPYWAQIFGLRVESGDLVQLPAPTPTPAPTPPSSTPPPPVTRDDVVIVPEDGAARIEPETEIVSVGPAAHGSVRLAAGNAIVYEPEPDYHGSDSFSYVTSGTRATVTVSVEPRNDAPDAAADRAATRPRHAVDVPVLANDADVDGDRVRIDAIVRAPYYGRATVDGGSIVYRARRGTAGRSDRLTYRVSDGNGGTALATVEVRIKR